MCACADACSFPCPINKTLANQPFPVINERTTVPLSLTARNLLSHISGNQQSLEDQMSDEIKKPELVNAGEEKQLDEKALDEVVGGDKVVAADSASPKLYEAACKGTHIPKVTVE
jgi:hypothetical protein